SYYEDAIRLDPNYALAWARLSSTCTLMVTTGDAAPVEYRAAIDKARKAADTALRLNPNLGDAHFARGILLQNGDLDWQGSDAEFARAMELQPRNALLMMSMGFHRSAAARFDEAWPLFRDAIAVDPLFSTPRVYFARSLIGGGAYDEAEATLRKSIEVQPLGSQNYMELAKIQLLRGNTAGAVELAKKETDPFWRNYTLALAYFANGDRAEADQQLKRLIDERADQAGAQIASVYALRKDADKMFEWLERARVTKDPGAFLVRIEPFLARYKDDPRYEAFCKKIGLPGPA
ncbi:MAG TPA: tetratricopeptide repeat protein, partial [Nevskiaceae bacterium]|nr:tetratricopeptide repeat protein [Nevskiaceae bacterium]